MVWVDHILHSALFLPVVPLFHREDLFEQSNTVGERCCQEIVQSLCFGLKVQM